MHKFKIYILLFSALLNGRAAAEDADQFRRDMLALYSGLDKIAVHAVDTKSATRYYDIAVADNGRYAFIQYDKDRYANIYGENRDVDAEWKLRPAHFDYYDGNKLLYSSASHDPARLYVEHTLPEPLAVGEAIQQKHCIWPVIPVLIESAEIQLTSDGGAIISEDSIELKIDINSRRQIVRLTWGEDRYPEAPGLVIAYSGYEGGSLFPTEMVRSFGLSHAGERVATHEHYNLRFETDPNRVEDMLVFKDPEKIYSRKVAETDNVYNAYGEFSYNEAEEAKKYLAAIKDSGPSQWRYLLLGAVAVAVFTSAWILKSRKSAA